MMNLKPNEQRAKKAILMIWIVLAAEIVSLISSCLQYDLLQTVANGGEFSAEAIEANDLRESLTGYIYLFFYIISIVTFIMWFRRAYYNLHQKVAVLSYSEDWAAGCWFVPILNWYRPYKIMKELYVMTRKLLVSKGLLPDVYYSTESVGWWWGLFLFSGFVGRISDRLSVKAYTVDKLLITATVVEIIVALIGIPLALITVKVIRDYSQMELLLLETEEENAEETSAVEI
jgi:hypothetical protein